MTLCDHCNQPIVLQFRTWQHERDDSILCDGLRVTPALLDLTSLEVTADAG